LYTTVGWMYCMIIFFFYMEFRSGTNEESCWIYGCFYQPTSNWTSIRCLFPMLFWRHYFVQCALIFYQWSITILIFKPQVINLLKIKNEVIFCKSGKRSAKNLLYRLTKVIQLHVIRWMYSYQMHCKSIHRLEERLFKDIIK